MDSATQMDVPRPLQDLAATDGAREVKRHTKKVIGFTDLVTDFVEKRLAIEQTALAALQQLNAATKRATDQYVAQAKLEKSAPSLLGMWTKLHDFSVGEHTIRSAKAAELSSTCQKIRAYSSQQRAVTKKLFGDRKAMDSEMMKEQEALAVSFKAYSSACAAREKNQKTSPAFMQNAHNEYYLLRASTAVSQAWHYSAYIPDTMNSFHDLHSRLGIRIQSQFQGVCEILQEGCREVLDLVAPLAHEVNAVDGSADVSCFGKSIEHQRQWRQIPPEPPVTVVSPELSAELCVNDATMPALKLLITNLTTERLAVVSRAELLAGQVQGAVANWKTYIATPSFGDPDVLFIELISLQKSLREATLRTKAIDVQLSLLSNATSALSDKPLSGRVHSWVPVRTGTCGYCGGGFVSFSKEKKCAICHLCVHEKCASMLSVVCAVASKNHGLTEPPVTPTSPSPTPTPRTRSAAPTPETFSQSVQTAIVNHTFEAQEPDQLSIYAGETIQVLDTSDPLNWWIGQSSRGRGVFPAKYVTLNMQRTMSVSRAPRPMAPEPSSSGRPAEEEAPPPVAPRTTSTMRNVNRISVVPPGAVPLVLPTGMTRGPEPTKPSTAPKPAESATLRAKRPDNLPPVSHRLSQLGVPSPSPVAVSPTANSKVSTPPSSASFQPQRGRSPLPTPVDDDDDDEDDKVGLYEEADVETTAKVLYDYQSNTEGDLNVRAGELVVVIGHLDKGWTECRQGRKVGVVPTSYLQIC
ncbi:SH3 domain-containing protein [Capsaspora owczarzaki ATCC 30864]|uniref:SH3 domain-containing protein n=1 Tax=Capsaspora owczarzaki (strain ATCC 30864) TaxID=595528 RepID=A0A0D2X3G3_CAPO3|nr:SH3 domain-containing protein [Capsaspora owczarzaki ATCC 30864]KJE94259.1 SH3 domain-containing protein [Capsaspora owczarzaki ATCC 30864]|eukprot:XP_004347678.2 SH3 domain-containing protein [Capsaspora owczarzaki ATCC 30864]